MLNSDKVKVLSFTLSVNWRFKAAQKIDSISQVYEHASNLGEVMVMKEWDPSSTNQLQSASSNRRRSKRSLKWLGRLASNLRVVSHT